MTLNEYQMAAHRTAEYPPEVALDYAVCGLCGEAGEVANKYKKVLRGDKPLDKGAIAKELGGVLWYAAELCTILGLTLDSVAAGNIAQLGDRQARGVIKGDGDDR